MRIKHERNSRAKHPDLGASSHRHLTQRFHRPLRGDAMSVHQQKKKLNQNRKPLNKNVKHTNTERGQR